MSGLDVIIVDDDPSVCETISEMVNDNYIQSRHTFLSFFVWMLK